MWRPPMSTELRRRLRAAMDGCRRIVGMPNYRVFVDHCREHHPDRPVPTEREYFEEYLRARYESGPTRCC